MATPVTSSASMLTSAGAGVLSSALNTTINNLFQTGVINAQKQYIQVQTQLSVLSNQQQEALALQLNNTQDSNEKLKILTDAVASVQAAQVSSTSKQKTTLIILAVSGAFLILVAAFIYKKSFK